MGFKYYCFVKASFIKNRHMLMLY